LNRRPPLVALCALAVLSISACVDDADSIRGFIVPTDTPGFTTRDQKGKLSLRAADTSELSFHEMRLPGGALLPESGGLKSPLMCLTQARYGIAWGAIGAAMALATWIIATLVTPLIWKF